MLSIFGKDSLWAMLLSILCFHIPILWFALYLSLFYKPNVTGPWPTNPNWKPKKANIVVDRLFRGSLVVGIAFFLVIAGVPFAMDLYDFTIHDSITTGSYLVTDKYVLSSWRMPIYYTKVQLLGIDDREFVMFFRRPQTIQPGRKYHLDIFYRSGIILKAAEVF